MSRRTVAGEDEPRCAAAGARSGRSASWSPSAAAPTRPSWPGWPPTPSGPIACSASPPSPRRWRPRSSPTAGPWPPSGDCGGATVATDELADPAYAANDARPLLPLQGEPARRPGPAGGRPKGPPSCLGVNLDDLGDHRPGQRPRPNAGRASHWWRPGSPRPTCAPCRGTSVCAPGTSRPRPAWPRASPTAPRSPWAPCDGGRGRVGPAGPGLPPAPGAPLRRPGPHRARCRRDSGARSSCAPEVVAAVHGAGYRYVTLDLEGFRSGNLNAGAGRRQRDRPAGPSRCRREAVHDRRPGQADVPRGAGARAAHRPAGARPTTSSPTSAAPTSTSTRDGSSASSTGEPDQDRRGRWPGCATRACGSTSSATSSRADRRGR